MDKHLYTLAQLVENAITRWRETGSANSKREFLSSARTFAREFKRDHKWDGEIRTNEGGPAVSGEVTIHTPTLYIMISADLAHIGQMYRSCNGMKDYTGGPNQWAANMVHLIEAIPYN